MVEATSEIYTYACMCVIGACLRPFYLWENTPLAFGNVQISLKLQLYNIHIYPYSGIYVCTYSNITGICTQYVHVLPRWAKWGNWKTLIRKNQNTRTNLSFDWLWLFDFKCAHFIKRPHMCTSKKQVPLCRKFAIFSILFNSFISKVISSALTEIKYPYAFNYPHLHVRICMFMEWYVVSYELHYYSLIRLHST